MRSVPGRTTAQPLGGNRVIGDQQTRGRRAGGDDVPRAGDSAARSLSRSAADSLARQSGFERERMMHQRDQPMLRARAPRPPPAARRRRVRRSRSAALGRQRGQPRAGGRAPPRSGAGKPSPRSSTSTCQPSCGKLRDDAPVIGVAAGRCREIAGHREHDLLHHNGASYQARADGDSATVTRIAASLASRRGRARRRARPRRAASNTYLVRNSVVVLTPLNCGRSSRLR